jgi:hypothetical protein
MRARRSAAALTAVTAVIVAIAVAGCGGASTSDQVKAKVTQFAHAVAKHDYTTICAQVLAPELLADITAGGLTCPKAMRIGLQHVNGASLTIGSVTINGKNAKVLTLTQAKHQSTALATLELLDTSNGWRISSLGNPT